MVNHGTMFFDASSCSSNYTHIMDPVTKTIGENHRKIQQTYWSTPEAVKARIAVEEAKVEAEIQLSTMGHNDAAGKKIYR